MSTKYFLWREYYMYIQMRYRIAGNFRGSKLSRICPKIIFTDLIFVNFIIQPFCTVLFIISRILFSWISKNCEKSESYWPWKFPAIRYGYQWGTGRSHIITTLPVVVYTRDCRNKWRRWECSLVTNNKYNHNKHNNNNNNNNNNNWPSGDFDEHWGHKQYTPLVSWRERGD